MLQPLGTSWTLKRCDASKCSTTSALPSQSTYTITAGTLSGHNSGLLSTQEEGGDSRAGGLARVQGEPLGPDELRCCCQPTRHQKVHRVMGASDRGK